MNSPGAAYVLVVEDDAKLARLLLDYLHAEGITARAIADGAQAVKVAEQDRPAVILLDLMLPGLDGVGVCRAVREFRDAPIIMVTARVDELDRILGLETGADDYVCKPFSPREVMARVKAQLRRVDSRRDQRVVDRVLGVAFDDEHRVLAVDPALRGSDEAASCDLGCCDVGVSEFRKRSPSRGG